MTMKTPTSPVVSTEWLQERLDDPTVRVLEIVNKPDLARYREGHIPGALGFFWKDICWHPTDREFITSEALARRLGAAGVRPTDTLVLYGDPVQYGTYAFWTFTMAGHRDLRVLDGTRTKWAKEGRPLTQDVPRFAPVEYATPAGDASMRVGRDEIRAGLGKPGRLLLDVRSPEEYRGERVMELPHFDHGAERAGRIPGAVHLYYKQFLTGEDAYRTPDEMRALLETIGATREKAAEIICYCRLSHRATLVWVAMKYLLGYPSVKLYDGSWTEWGSIVGFPVEK
jgi:thiosulfate/3-mercaptopyruvate sulfurtransferase